VILDFFFGCTPWILGLVHLFWLDLLFAFFFDYLHHFNFIPPGDPLKYLTNYYYCYHSTTLAYPLLLARLQLARFCFSPKHQTFSSLASDARFLGSRLLEFYLHFSVTRFDRFRQRFSFDLAIRCPLSAPTFIRSLARFDFAARWTSDPGLCSNHTIDHILYGIFHNTHFQPSSSFDFSPSSLGSYAHLLAAN
jgi:hypothetical protein